MALSAPWGGAEGGLSLHLSPALLTDETDSYTQRGKFTLSLEFEDVLWIDLKHHQKLNTFLRPLGGSVALLSGSGFRLRS